MSEDRENQKPAQPARPTGKRQLTGAGPVTGDSYVAKRAEPSPEQDGPGGGAASYLPEVVTEMRKVIWPTAQQMITYTLVVFAFLIVLTVLVAGVDFLAGAGVEWALTSK
ncbi:preprotein translocase subunit SecE [Corynebacterium sp. MSK006]|uniref:preprotein translocase subunit SecE n=1 Tax=Corynebacterium TaxID=1716 RepID=UPI002550D357|nr:MULTISPECIES: preprotein translocase subunit SecE [Corynebacterium]MDK8895290.1 preprotein translocase subunit SecE [Corynebacterium sp. MSK006]